MGCAVNRTVFPAQTGFKEDVILSETGICGLTIMVMALEVAGLLKTQIVFDEEIIQLTTSLLRGV